MTNSSMRTGRAGRWVGGLVPSALLLAIHVTGIWTGATAGAQEPELDESCVVSVLNRTARVEPSGTWVLPNVPAGIGQVRLRATCVDDGTTRAGQSDYFLVPADGAIRVSDIRFNSPEPVPERLTVSSPVPALTQPGQTATLEVLAHYPDGTTGKVAAASAGTNYIVSNPAVATISPDGELTAVASGTVIVNASNEGATGFLRLQVVLSGDTDGDGIPDDVEVSLGLDPNDPVDALVDPDGDGLINRDEVAYGTDPNNPDSDRDGLTDGEEVTLTGTDPALFDTDGDGMSDGLEIATGSDPLDPASYDLAAALTGLAVHPASFVLNTNTVLPGEASVGLRVEGSLLDGTTIDLTPTARGTAYNSSDLGICNFGLENGVVFGGAEGGCTITASNSGFQATAEGLVQEFTPAPIAGVELPSYGNSVAVADGWAFVAGGPGGLHVVDVRVPRQPRIATTLPLSGNASDVVLAGEMAYIAAGTAGVHVVDVGQPWAPALLSSADTPGEAIALRVAGDLVYVADGAEGLQVLSVADPSSPVTVGAWSTAGEANGLAVAGELAVVSTWDGPLELIDVSSPSAPVGVSTLPVPAETFDVEILGSYAYVATSNDLRVVDVSDPQVPVDLGAYGAGIWMLDLLAVGEDRIFTTQVEPRTRMPIFDLRGDPAAPFFAGLIQFSDATGTGGDGLHIAADSHFAYMTASVGFEVRSKPGTTGATRLLVGQHSPLEDLEGQAPDVSIAGPADGAEVVEGVPFEVSAEAADDIGVLDVNLLVDGDRVARDTFPPYRFIITAPPAPALVRIGAVARDFGGNERQAAEIVVQSVAGVGSTRVVGSVRTGAGAPVAGATVFTSIGGTATTLADGSFSIDALPAISESLIAFATGSVSGGEFRGRSAPVPVVADGVTDTGVITVAPLGLPYAAPRVTTSGRVNGAQAMAAADFDGDGLIDLAVAPEPPEVTVGIFLGRGDRSFGPRLDLPGGSSPRDLVAADLNLDGSIDVAVVNSASADVRVYLGLGDGTFQDAAIYGAANGPTGIAVGDIDRDLIPDLVAAGGSDPTVLTYLGVGDGTFASPGTVALGADPEGVRLADFDADGSPDLVTQTNLVVALGVGDGTFGTPMALLPESTVHGLEVGDVNEDGLPDIVALDDRPFEIDRISTLVSRGDGTFDRLTASFDPGGTLALGDLNVDGRLDVVTTSSSTSGGMVVPLLGDGTGAFLTLPAVPAGDFTGDDLLVADLDEDGIADLVVSGRAGATVLAGVGTGSFASYERHVLFDSRDGAHLPMATGDVDGDGRDDLIVGDFRSVNVHLRDPEVGFSPGAELALAYEPRDVLAKDLNGDGAPEIVTVGGSTVSVFTNTGGGTFSSPEERPGSGITFAVEAAEVTGDGFIDLLTLGGGQVGVLENDGSGSFGSPQLFSTGDVPVDLAVLDFDLDGDLDLAVARGESRPINLLTNDGSGAFTVTGSIFLERAPGVSGASPSSIATGDLNGDGLGDLVTSNFAARSVSVFLGLGGGAFSGEARVAVGSAPRTAILSDVDFDGVVDVITVNSGTHDISVLRGLGDGRFASEQPFATSTDPRRAVMLDLNQDGLQDDLVVGTERDVNLLVHQ